MTDKNDKAACRAKGPKAEGHVFKVGLTLLLVVSVLQSVAAAAPPTVAALQIVAPNGKESVLIPGLHAAARDILLPDSRLWDGKKRLLVEHMDTGEAEQLAMVFVPHEPEPRAPWAQNLTAAELRIYHDRARCDDVVETQADWLLSRPSPWLANLFAYSTCSPFVSRDTEITREAQALKLDVVPLETDEFAAEQRIGLPPDVSEGAFRWALAHDPTTVLNESAALINAGRYADMRKLADESWGEPRFARTANLVLVEQRNMHWMTILERELDLGGNVILVGADHLPGRNGLIALLRSAGYSVTATKLGAVRAQ
ncbi:hypothetical protein SAMN05414139_10799 [Burkholderia sp. D7]|nr:hypothetical protein SAMN05414139_10799 [Burkholderia sp. D7]